jgi:hypothetical protein
MFFGIEFVKFDAERTASRATTCLAKRFDSADQARAEAERELAKPHAIEGTEGFRIVESGFLIIEEQRFSRTDGAVAAVDARLRLGVDRGALMVVD